MTDTRTPSPPSPAVGSGELLALADAIERSEPVIAIGGAECPDVRLYPKSWKAIVAALRATATPVGGERERIAQRVPERETLKQILVDMIQRNSNRLVVVDYETTIDYLITAFVPNGLSPPGADRDYTAWLIETDDDEGPIYFQLVDDDNWSSDHNTALQFARKQDAEKYIADIGWTCARAVEHMWPNIRTRPLSAGVGREAIIEECANVKVRLTNLGRRSEDWIRGFDAGTQAYLDAIRALSSKEAKP